MFTVQKTLEVAISHSLTLPYDSPCERDHGHNLIITVFCQADELNENNMVIDFTEIKRVVHGRLDHQCLNRLEGIGFEWVNSHNFTPEGGDPPIKKLRNPTAERLAKWICMQIESCYRVDVQESTGNVATYEED